ncbi:MAG: 50S ribosomal protein L6, partial [Candidatus Thiodiazotropha endolucinida]
MSRVAKSPITLPSGVTVKKSEQSLSVKGPKGEMEMEIHPSIDVSEEENSLKVAPKNEDKATWAMAGTMRALVNNMVTGVSQGFEKKLQLVGVGYRAQAGGKSLNLNLGFSHPIDYPVPEGISIATPSATEIVVS